jgi:exodeoxyribonuclease VII small subunit
MSTDDQSPINDNEPAQIEELLDDIESLVEALEGGELSLDESMERFEKGMTMVRQGRAILEAAERRLEELVAETEDGPITRDLDLDTSSD